MHNIGNHNISNMVLYCLLDEINGPTASLENARDFLFQKNLLKNSMSCPGCNAAMSLVPCSSSSKSPNGLIWWCSPCKKYRNIRIDSALSGQKIALKTFIQLLFCLSEGDPRSELESDTDYILQVSLPCRDVDCGRRPLRTSTSAALQVFYKAVGRVQELIDK